MPLVNLIFVHINISFNGEMSQKNFYEMGLTTIITFKIWKFLVNTIMIPIQPIATKDHTNISCK